MNNESSNDGAVESGVRSADPPSLKLRRTRRGRPRKLGRRPASNTAVRQLTPEQRARVDGWLFDGELSYREVVALCQKELGTPLSVASLSRYFQQELAC